MSSPVWRRRRAHRDVLRTVRQIRRTTRELRQSGRPLAPYVAGFVDGMGDAAAQFLAEQGQARRAARVRR